MKRAEKKQLIVKLIEKYVANGMDITEFIGKPLNYFDEEKIEVLINNKYLWKTY